MTTAPFVLAVDDEAGILRLLKLELEEQDFHVVTAASGEEALRVAQEQRPDIVLLDILMPDMSGLEVMRRLREISNAPIMLVTAKDADADKVRGLGFPATSQAGAGTRRAGDHQDTPACGQRVGEP